MDAKEYDPQPARRRWSAVWLGIFALVVFAVLWFWPSGRFRYRQQWKIAGSFFSAIERRDFDAAYGLYNADPGWKQHADKYRQYTFEQFKRDWSESPDLGTINSHRVMCVAEPPRKDFSAASGVAVVVEVNQRPDPAILWIENKSGVITTAPWTLYDLTRDSALLRAFCNPAQ